MTSIIIRNAQGKTRVVTNQPFNYEEILQNKIAEIPDLLPLEAVTEGEVSHITIGYEWSAGSGKADIVLLGSDGVLTIVETKLKRNPQARREVIAQVLEYGAYLSELTIWDVAHEAEEFFKTPRARADHRNKSFTNVLQDFLEDEPDDLESFRTKVEKNLREGHIRLVVAVDEVGEQAQKIIAFVNSASNFDIYLLQIAAYADGDQEVFVPTLFGYARKAPPSHPRIQWSWDKYQSELGWTSEQVSLGRILNDRLQRLTSEWEPEIRFNHGWTTFYIDDKSVFGVTKSAARGIELWFRLDTKPNDLPPEVRAHSRGKGYVYLGGEPNRLTDDQMKALCTSSLAIRGVAPRQQ